MTSSDDENYCNRRMTQCCRTSSCRASVVLYRARTTMKMTKVTLSLPCMTSSPDEIHNFDIDVTDGVQRLCIPDYKEKSYKVFYDLEKGNKKSAEGEIIVKEKGKIIWEVPISDLLNSEAAYTLGYLQMKLKASPSEWKFPDVRVFDDNTFTCRKEMNFLKKRKLFVQGNLKKLLGDTNALEDVDKIPHIALMGSGGGYRAMVAMSGIVNALDDTCLLDCISYTVALSGSSWYIASLYSHPHWPHINPRTIQNEIRKRIVIDPINPKNFSYYFLDYMYKKMTFKKWDFTTDTFGPLLGAVLLPNRMPFRWSEVADKLREGLVPLPLLSAIHAKENESAKEFHEWVEFSPFEVSIAKYGASIEMKNFGSEFKQGLVTKEQKELPLFEIMGICGSAFTITYDEYQDLQTHLNNNREQETCVYPYHDVETDCNTLSRQNSKQEHGQTNHSVQEHGQPNQNATEAENKDDEIVKELEAMFETFCKLREESGISNSEKEDDITDGVPKTATVKDEVFQEKLKFSYSIEELDDIETDSLITEQASCIIDIIGKRVGGTRRGRAAFVNNFLRHISFDGCPMLSRENPLFENFLKNNPEKLCCVDAGLAFNSPYPLLLRPGRDIDLILSFDFTDRKKDDNMPFKTILEAEEWAKTHNVKFPNVKDNICKYQNEAVKELYVFEDETDMECPIIMHFVLVNNDFRKYKKPGEEWDPSERQFADFHIYDDQTTYDSKKFCYTEEDFDRLSQLAEFIVLNNIEHIKACIRKSIRNKIRRTRQRHNSY